MQRTAALCRGTCAPVRRLQPSRCLAPRQVLFRPAQISCRRHLRIVPCAVSGAGSAGDDPYQVLGLGSNASGESIQRAYNKKKLDAKGNDSALQRIEAAHSRIMMQQLTQRMKGGGDIAKEVKYADRAQYLPWRPRLYMAEKNFIMLVGAVQALLAAWALLLSLTAGTQPLIASTVLSAGANVYKQNTIFPPPQSSSASESEKRQGMKNILRGMILAFMATFLGCAMVFSVPDWIAATFFKRALPYWVYEKETMLLCVGTAVANFIMTSFYR